MAACTDRLRSSLTDELGLANVRINGPASAAHRLPNTLSIGVRGVVASEVKDGIWDGIRDGIRDGI